MRRIALIALAALAAAPATAAAQDALVKNLTRNMRAAGAHSGAYVVNLTDGQTVFRWREKRSRILASNTKLFTTAAALARFGTEGTLGTEGRTSRSLRRCSRRRGSPASRVVSTATSRASTRSGAAPSRATPLRSG